MCRIEASCFDFGSVTTIDPVLLQTQNLLQKLVQNTQANHQSSYTPLSQGLGYKKGNNADAKAKPLT